MGDIAKGTLATTNGLDRFAFIRPAATRVRSDLKYSQTGRSVEHSSRRARHYLGQFLVSPSLQDAHRSPLTQTVRLSLTQDQNPLRGL